jgi:paraquat-inducible protein B
MSRKANKAVIGIFVAGAVALLVIAVMVFGSGLLFKASDKYVLFFDGSVKGLSVGAPVIFRGVKIGSISDISLVYNPKEDNALICTVIDIELSRVKGVPERLGYPNYMFFIKEGLRARLEIQNFITGQLMIALDFYPDRPEKFYNIIKGYPELPTVPISPDIFQMMNEIPIKQISDDLEDAAAGLNRLLSSEGISQLDKTLQEVRGAARSMRLLTEYLEQHPEALLKGKPVLKGE